MIFPKSKSGAKLHRKRKRELEMDLIIRAISDLISINLTMVNKNIRILEFGCGNGFQVPYLNKIGSVTASDVYTSDDVKEMKGLDFHECSITNTPFRDGHFDVVFSNHVIEHIEDRDSAFREIKRIGAPDCIYAFSVPTNIWLLISIPSLYFNRLKSFCRALFFGKKCDVSAVNIGSNGKWKGTMCKLLPGVHGAYSDFVECYKSFIPKSWIRLFLKNGFSIIKVQPLLLYGPSEWPILPTTKKFNRFNICSSMLFLMKKQFQGE